jgi:hypothetical protein
MANSARGIVLRLFCNVAFGENERQQQQQKRDKKRQKETKTWKS